MSFMEGLLQLKDKVAHLPQWKREKVRGWLGICCCVLLRLCWTTGQIVQHLLYAQVFLYVYAYLHFQSVALPVCIILLCVAGKVPPRSSVDS